MAVDADKPVPLVDAISFAVMERLHLSVLLARMLLLIRSRVRQEQRGTPRA